MHLEHNDSVKSQIFESDLVFKQTLTCVPVHFCLWEWKINSHGALDHNDLFARFDEPICPILQSQTELIKCTLFQYTSNQADMQKTRLG